MKKAHAISIAVIAASVLWIASGLIIHPGNQDVQKTGDAGVAHSPQDQKLAQVRVRNLVAEDVAGDVIVTGRTQASKQVDLRAEIAGAVADIPVTEGAIVKKGDVIVRLDERDHKAHLVQAQERLKQREIEYNAVKSLETQGFNSRTRLAQSRADLETARAELKQSEIDLDHISMTAPFDGVAYKKSVDEGDYVAVGDVVYAVAALDPIEVTGFITEKQVHEIRPGSPARIVMIDGEILEGTVSYIAPVADERTRTFAIKATTPNPLGKMAQGMTAEIHIPMDTRRAHKISPSILTLDDTGRMGVKTLDAKNKVAFVPVSIIADETGFVWVEGLPEKVRVITVGQEFVFPGQVVEPTLSTGAGLL